MKSIIIAVRDKKADVYGLPNCVHNDAIAIRSFSDQVNKQDSANLWNQHPSDFALYKIGTYDDQTAQIETLQTPDLLIEADQCVSIIEVS
jgi:hypothetical protein